MLGKAFTLFSVLRSRWFCVAVLTAGIAGACLDGVSYAQPVNINGYRYLLLPDDQNDQLGICTTIRQAAAKAGMQVVTDSSSLEEEQLLEAIGITWGTDPCGQMNFSCGAHVRATDLYSGATVGEASANGSALGSVNKSILKGARNAWEKLGYRGFSQAVHDANLRALYPSRPILQISEEGIRGSTLTSPIEGIWSSPDNKYTIGIVADKTHRYGDFVAVILRTNSPVWRSGEVKFELSASASPKMFIGNYYMGNKRKLGANYILDGPGVLKASMTRPDGRTEDSLFVRVFPAVASSESSGAAPARGTSIGTGFLIAPGGYVATNFHVVQGSTGLTVTFPKQMKEYKARLILKDAQNDLAIIQLQSFSMADVRLAGIPYSIKRTGGIGLGDKIYTIGYPLQDIMGSNPKYTEGVVSSKSGMGDDPRVLQISASIQPGNSGSPLYDTSGSVVGVVVSTMNAAFLYNRAQSLPQNVNFAVKADYLLSLIDMLPEPIVMPARSTPTPPDELAKYSVLITATH